MDENNQSSQDQFSENETAGSPSSQCLLPEDSDSENQEENDYKIKCSHRTAPDFKTYFEIVPDIGAGYPYDDTVTIEWTGPQPPDTIKVKGPGCKLEKTNPYSFNFKELYQQNKKLEDIFYANFKKTKEAAVREIFRSMWTWNKYHKFSVSPLVAPRSIDLYLYNPETWKLEISFPPGRKYSNGRKLDKVVKGKDAGKVSYSKTETRESSSLATGQHHTTTSKSGTDGTSEETKNQTITASSTKGIKVWRNGSAEKIDFLTTISSALRLIKLFQHIADAIQDNVPKIGWYMDYEMSVFDGSMSLEWGWKESTSASTGSGTPDLHQAIYEVKMSGQINLIEVKFETGLALQTPGFKAQLFISIGGSIALSPSITTQWHPREDFKSGNIEIPIDGKIIGTGGVRVEVGYVVNLEFTIETGLYTNFTLKVQRTGDWLNLAGVYGFSGIIGKATMSYGKHGGYGEKRKVNKELTLTASGASATAISEGSASGEHVFLEPVRIGNFKWPSEPEYPKNNLNDKQFEKIILNFLEGKIMVDGKEDHGEWALTVLWQDEKTGVFTFDYEKVPRELIAQEIVALRRGVVIDRSRKSLEGFAHKVRKRLEELRVRQGLRFRYIKGSDYNDFLNNDLPKMYDEIKDTIYYYQLDCTS